MTAPFKCQVCGELVGGIYAPSHSCGGGIPNMTVSVRSGTNFLPPEGMEWLPGRCPNVGRACNCTGACHGRWVPVGTVQHCSTCRCATPSDPATTEGDEP